MMIMKGASTLMSHQAGNAAASAANALKYRKDLAIKKRFELQASQARQQVADLNVMRVKNMDIKADAMMQNRLKELRVQGTVAALAGPAGKSTEALTQRGIGQVLQQEGAFLKEMETKAQQLAYKDREIQQGMDMAWLDANAQIAGTSYQKGPGAASLVFGMGSAAMDAYTFDKKMDSSWG